MSVIQQAQIRAFGAGASKPTDEGPYWAARDLFAAALILLAVVALFLSAPRAGEFWWSDAPRHALNGAFLHDFAREMPLDDPDQWAVDYYFRLPALTILFYPPLFPAVEAVVFAAFGVSPAAAQGTVALFAFLAGFCAYLLARNWFDRGVATGCALLFLGLPEIGLWGRQVMLEVPLAAMMLAAMAAFLAHVRRGGAGWLYATAALMVATLYTKQTAVFLLPAMALVLLRARGWKALSDRHLWIATAVSVLALVPLAWMTLEFGATNVQSVTGVQDAAVARTSAANWTWYLKRIPAQVGWPVAMLAAVWSALALWNRSWRLPRTGQLALIAWFLSGYAFFTLISLKEQRFTLAILFPVVVAATALVEGMAPRRLAGTLMMLFGASMVIWTVVARPVPEISGYREAAGWIAEHAEPRSVVLFSGARDGSFIFNLRSFGERDDLAVVRADKLLLRVAVRRTLGVEQQAVERAALAARIDDLGVRYVVADPKFWTDLDNMAMLVDLLESDRFERVASVPISANVPNVENEVRIYRNLGRVATDPGPFTMRLEMIDRTIRSSGR